MGKFVNKNYKDTVDSIVDIGKDLLKNPYYLFNDKKACSVNYYHISAEKSTMDEASRIPYSELGDDCPFRFNLIKDFFVYGIERVQLSLENGDQGLESGEIAGEAIILPGTITPYPGDYFEIQHIHDSTWLFRVNQVDKDTLDDGANIWKISYKLEHTDNSNIINLIADDYTMVIDYVGTEYNPILKSNKYEVIKDLDDICVQLKRYFKELFYNDKVQTFIFTNVYEDKFYDPYMIEFLIRNKIMENSGQKDYIYIDHKLPVPKTFSIDYNNTFFRSFESKDKKHLLKSMKESTADYISNIISIFNSRPEDYFQLNYKVYTYEDVSICGSNSHNVLDCFPKEIVENIVNGELFKEEDKYIYNIMVKYFNNIDYEEIDFECVESIDYSTDMHIFFLIPIIIFCLESYIVSEITKKDLY